LESKKVPDKESKTLKKLAFWARVGHKNAPLLPYSLKKLFQQTLIKEGRQTPTETTSSPRNFQ